jgi:hypothetical protein
MQSFITRDKQVAGKHSISLAYCIPRGTPSTIGRREGTFTAEEQNSISPASRIQYASTIRNEQRKREDYRWKDNIASHWRGDPNTLVTSTTESEQGTLPMKEQEYCKRFYACKLTYTETRK